MTTSNTVTQVILPTTFLPVSDATSPPPSGFEYVPAVNFGGAGNHTITATSLSNYSEVAVVAVGTGPAYVNYGGQEIPNYYVNDASTGNDSISLTAGSGIVIPGYGNDTISIQGGGNSIGTSSVPFGQHVNDSITIGFGNDTVYAFNLLKV